MTLEQLLNSNFTLGSWQNEILQNDQQEEDSEAETGDDNDLELRETTQK